MVPPTEERPDTLSAIELECAICLCIYKKPKLLQCMHTFCEECIVKLMTDGNPDGTTIICPNCRYQTKVPVI